jgi:hypothetical protein
VAIPLVMGDTHIPQYMCAKNMEEGELHSEMCDMSMIIKNRWIFPLTISNGQRYVALQNVLCDTQSRPSLLSCVNNVEKYIEETFMPLYISWIKGDITDDKFNSAYDNVSSLWFQKYQTTFAEYIK